MDVTNPKRKRSLFDLLGELPALVRGLIEAEIAAFKAELIAKGKSIGVGVALFSAAAFLAFWAFAVLIASAVLAFALVLPGWAAALVVAAILIVIIALLVLIGWARLKQGTAASEESVGERIQHDVDAVKGVGDYDR